MSKFTGDRRTKEYKVWKQNQALKPKLGDVIETITEATGIKKAVETILGKDCGCDERKEFLNKLLPTRTKSVRCLTEDQLIEYKNHINTRTLNEYPRKTAKMLIDLYAHIFAIQYNINDFASNCAGCAKKLYYIEKQLDIVYKSYD